MKRLVLPVVAFLFLSGVMSQLALTPSPKVMEPPAVRLGELAGYASEKLDISEAELSVLPADTRFDKRKYTGADGNWYAVSIVIGGTSKSSIHRPELCLPAQGFLMQNPRTREVAGTSWRLITLAGRSGESSNGFAYTFFNQAGFRTSSHVRRIFQDVWDRSFLNRIDRWVMVTVSCSHGDEKGLCAFLARLKEILP